MNEVNEERILRRMRTVAGVCPSAEETARAIRAARWAMIRRRAMRWMIAGSVAAAMAVMVGMLLVGPRTVSAAEAVTQAAQRTKDYKGWVHMKNTEHQKDVKAGKEAYSITHLNNETGAWATELHGTDGSLVVTIYDTKDSKEVTYSSKTGEVRIADLWEGFAQGWQKEIQAYPLTAAAFLAKAPGVTVRESKEGGLLRYDYTLPKPEGLKPEEEAWQPKSCVAWADPETKLIAKAETAYADYSITEECTYGGAGVGDVYDMGVPRTARVVDLRPSKELKDLFARLDKRTEEGFGDYTGVETITPLKDDGTLEPSVAQSWLWGKSGKGWVKAEFVFGELTDRKGRVVAKRPDRPEGWPIVDIDVYLKAVEGREPAMFVSSDGTRGWIGYANEATKQVMEGKMDLEDRFGNLGPTRRRLGLFGRDTKMEVVREAGHPGMLGFRCDSTIFISRTEQQRREQLYWIDPNKDDVMVESLIQDFEPEGTAIEMEFHTVCTEFAQAKNGRWYASVWVSKTTSHDQKKREIVSEEEHRLKIWSGRVLGKEWFGDLARRGEAR